MIVHTERNIKSARRPRNIRRDQKNSTLDKRVLAKIERDKREAKVNDKYQKLRRCAVKRSAATELAILINKDLSKNDAAKLKKLIKANRKAKAKL